MTDTAPIVAAVDVTKTGGLDDVGRWHDVFGRFARKGWTGAKAAALNALTGDRLAEAARTRPDGVEARVEPTSGLSARLGAGPLRARWRDAAHAVVDVDGRPTLIPWGDLTAVDQSNDLVERPVDLGVTARAAVARPDLSFAADTTIPWEARVARLAAARDRLAADLGKPDGWFTSPHRDTVTRLWKSDAGDTDAALTPEERESLDRVEAIEEFGQAVATLVAERAVTHGATGGAPRQYTPEMSKVVIDELEQFRTRYDEALEAAKRDEMGYQYQYRVPPGKWHGDPEAVAVWDEALERVAAGHADIVIKPKSIMLWWRRDDDKLVRVTLEKDDHPADRGASTGTRTTKSGRTLYNLDESGHISIKVGGNGYHDPSAWIRGTGRFTEAKTAIQKAFKRSKKDLYDDHVNPPTLRAWTETMEALGFDMGVDPDVLVNGDIPRLDSGAADRAKLPTAPLQRVGDVKASTALGQTIAAGFAPYPRSWTSLLPPQHFDPSNDARSRTGSALNATLPDGGGNYLRVPSVAGNPQNASAVAHEVGHSMQGVVPGLHRGEQWHMISRLRDHPGEQTSEVAGGRGTGFRDGFADAYSGRFYPGPNPLVPEDKRGGYLIVNGADPYKEPDGEALPAAQAFELFTTGVQGLYSTKRRHLGDDPRLTAFTVGMLTLAVPPDRPPAQSNDLPDRPARTVDGFDVGATSVKLNKLATPPAPGRATIPAGATRLYHVTSNGESLQSILATGLTTEFEGSGYGRHPEHPGMVWATTAKPDEFDSFVEFWMNPDEVTGTFDAVRMGAVPPDRIVSYSTRTLASLRAYRRMTEAWSPEEIAARPQGGSETQRAAWRLLLAERGVDAAQSNDLVDRPPVRFDGMHPAGPDDTRAHGALIPKAWTDVWISDRPQGVNGMIARGVDTAGRSQRLYSTAHTEQQAAAKFARLAAFRPYLDGLDAALDRDVESDDTAAALALVRATGMRPGSTADTGAKVQAYGATTLLARHVTLDGARVSFDFTGKKGVNIHLDTDDPIVVRAVRARLDGKAPDEPMFATDAVKVNAYLDRETAPEFKVKDLRTVKANVVAARMVADRPSPPATEKERKAWINEVGDAVSAALGNTRAVALASYINPVVFGPWQPQSGMPEANDMVARPADGPVDLAAVTGRGQPYRYKYFYDYTRPDRFMWETKDVSKDTVRRRLATVSKLAQAEWPELAAKPVSIDYWMDWEQYRTDVAPGSGGSYPLAGARPDGNGGVKIVVSPSIAERLFEADDISEYRVIAHELAHASSSVGGESMTISGPARVLEEGMAEIESLLLFARRVDPTGVKATRRGPDGTRTTLEGLEALAYGSTYKDFTTSLILHAGMQVGWDRQRILDWLHTLWRTPKVVERPDGSTFNSWYPDYERYELRGGLPTPEAEIETEVAQIAERWDGLIERFPEHAEQYGAERDAEIARVRTDGVPNWQRDTTARFEEAVASAKAAGVDVDRVPGMVTTAEDQAISKELGEDGAHRSPEEAERAGRVANSLIYWLLGGDS